MKETSPAVVYLTWNDSRRSRSLSKMLGAQRRTFVCDMESWLRHPLGALETSWYLLCRRPEIVWYQYSYLLGLVLAIYSCLRRVRVTLVVDMHTKALRRSGPRILRPLVLAVKGWMLRRCRSVLVTNPQNAAYVRRFGLEPLLLPDPLPEVPAEHPSAERPTMDLTFICSFAEDEPLPLILELCRSLPRELQVAITGNARLLQQPLRDSLGSVARLTGFLPEREYWSLLRGSRCVAVLSTTPACLPCGAYEAIAVGRRPIVADDAISRSVFGASAIYARLDVATLSETILRQVEDEIRPELAAEYVKRFEPYWRRVDAVVRARPEPWIQS